MSKRTEALEREILRLTLCLRYGCGDSSLEELRESVRWWRKAAEIKVGAIAEQLGVCPATIYNREKHGNIYKIAELFEAMRTIAKEVKYDSNMEK